MALQLDLNKSAQSLRLSLDKAGVAANIRAELIFDIDVSGSFEHEHEEGTTGKLVSRLVPYGMVLDPDGKVDLFTFSNGPEHVHHVGTVTPDESDNYIVRNVIDRVPGWNGGTSYSYVLERNLQHFGWLPMDRPVAGFFSRFFGGGKAAAPVEKKRSVVIFITDGENDQADEARTMQVLQASQDRGDQVYFLFMGACEDTVEFRFLNTIAERFRNTGVVIVRDLDSFVDLSDDELNTRLLVPELLEWLRG
ncbi:MAG: VWA domain-containing protein [Pseudomonadota bacterium]